MALPRIVELVLYTPYRAFTGRAAHACDRSADASRPRRWTSSSATPVRRFTSPYWAWNEAIRLLAMNGYRAALGARELRQAVQRQEQWMLRIGNLKSAA